MKPSVAIALLLAAPALVAAPVPKEVRASPSHVGTWQCVTLDPNDPAKRTPSGQVWIIGTDCRVAFHGTGHLGPVPEPTERLAFDPNTGEVEQSNLGGNGLIRMGRYKIEGDLLTVVLNSVAATPRPVGVVAGPGTRVWHLLRVTEAKR